MLQAAALMIGSHSSPASGSLEPLALPALRQAHSMSLGEAKIAVHDQTRPTMTAERQMRRFRSLSLRSWKRSRRGTWRFSSGVGPGELKIRISTLLLGKLEA